MLEPLHSVTTFVTPEIYAVMKRICAIEGISVYALVKRAVMIWLVAWVREHPERLQDALCD